MDTLIIDADLDGHWKRLDWLNGLNAKQTPWLAMYHLVVALGPRTGHKHNRQREPPPQKKKSFQRTAYKKRIGWDFENAEMKDNSTSRVQLKDSERYWQHYCRQCLF